MNPTLPVAALLALAAALAAITTTTAAQASGHRPAGSREPAACAAPHKGERASTATVDTLTDSQFAAISGVSFHEGCGITRRDLRIITLRHKDARGRDHTGRMIANARIAGKLAAIFDKLYRAGYPIERVSPIDEYGASDRRSMEANNTSCLNCRRIAGSRSLSRHALGLAVDINPLYNPDVRRGRANPRAGQPYADRSRAFDYKITRGDLLHRLMTAAGFQWGGAWRSHQDYQHFEYRE